MTETSDKFAQLQEAFQRFQREPPLTRRSGPLRDDADMILRLLSGDGVATTKHILARTFDAVLVPMKEGMQEEGVSREARNRVNKAVAFLLASEAIVSVPGATKRQMLYSLPKERKGRNR